MTICKKHCILLAVMITAAGIGCKKSKQSLPPPVEKKAVVTTIAGEGSDAFENGPVMLAKFHTPIDVAVAPDGTIYVTDYNDRRIRKIAGGEVSTLAGNGSFGVVNGDGNTAQFVDPFRIAVDAAGNCYSIDQADSRIRKITPSGVVTTYAGMDSSAFLDGPAETAQFRANMGGIACDAAGNIYVGDALNGRIRQVSVAGQVSTAAGDGNTGYTNGDRGTAQFWFPSSVVCDRQGNVYIVDPGNLRIRKLSTDGIVSTLTGSGISGTADGEADVAQFNSMGDMVVDSQGNIYIIDGDRIRKVTPQGKMSTIAGSTTGYADGDGATAKFNYPGGLGIDAQDNIYVADANNNRIRKISFQ